VTSPWWAACGPAEAEVGCGAGKHRLRWADGTLQAADHPDAEGELVLAALGGDVTPCLELVRAWGQHSDDLAVLAIGPRSAADKLTITTAVLDELAVDPRARLASLVRSGHTLGHRSASLRPGPPRFSSAVGMGGVIGGARFTTARLTPLKSAVPKAVGWTGRRSRGWPAHQDDPARTELARLLALGAPFQWRLSGAVAHAWSGDGEHASRQDRQRPALTAALAGRLGPAAAQWLDIHPGDVDASIHAGPGWGQLSLNRSAAKPRLVASLPVGWLAAAWAPGLAVVAGRLVVSVLHASWPDARVLAIRSPDRDPVELSIRYDKEHWRVASR
jgi:hypothetical protein